MQKFPEIYLLMTDFYVSNFIRGSLFAASEKIIKVQV